MPDVSSRMKRPHLSGFGEGTVIKRPRNNVGDETRKPGAHPSIAKAIVSGPGNGFRATPVPTSAGAHTAPRAHGMSTNFDEAAASFGLSASRSVAKTRVHLKPPFPARPPPLLLSEENPFAEPEKKVRQFETRSESSLSNGFRFPQPSSTKLEAPRKVLPFSLLRVPVSIPDNLVTQSMPTSARKPSIPKFDLGEKAKGKMVAMTAMEPPMVESVEDGEVEGESLELRRGLDVSPQKGDRRKGKFLRNGLAERARTIINRSSTADILWRKDAEASTARSGYTKADIRLCVKDVVRISRNEKLHSRSAGNIRSILAVCVLPNGEECNVLFSFPRDGLESDGFIRKEAEVLVWEPWQKTKNPSTMFCSRFIALSSSS